MPGDYTADLTHAQPGDKYATRAGWTATITAVSGWRATGYVDTDYMRYTNVTWSQQGTARHRAEDLVELISTAADAPVPRRRGLFSWLLNPLRLQD